MRSVSDMLRSWKILARDLRRINVTSCYTSMILQVLIYVTTTTMINLIKILFRFNIICTLNPNPFPLHFWYWLLTQDSYFQVFLISLQTLTFELTSLGCRWTVGKTRSSHRKPMHMQNAHNMSARHWALNHLVQSFTLYKWMCKEPSDLG